MNSGFTRNPVLFRINVLLVLLVGFGLLVAGLLVYHSRAQQQLYNKMGNFHTPTIYYSERLIKTLLEIENSFHMFYQSQLEGNDEVLFADTIVNPVYSIKSYISTINNLDARYVHPETENARRRLNREIDLLVEMLNEFPIARDEHIDILPSLIDVARLRAQQFLRLHVNANDTLRQKLAVQVQTNAAFLLQIIVITAIVGAVLVFPMIMKIRNMVNALHASEIEQRHLTHIAEKEQSRMSALLSAMNIGILFEDKHGQIEFSNPAFQQMWALERDKSIKGQRTLDILNLSPLQIYCPDFSSKSPLEFDDSNLNERSEINLSNGRILAQMSYPVLDKESIHLGRLWLYEDITHEKQTANQLLYLAEHDHLTGLYNRHRFQQHLSFMIESCRRNQTKFALLYFDLDEFKFINDTFGHGAGDSVLLRTASVINALVRGAEMFARLGGDEFAIIISLAVNEKLEALPERIVNAVSTIPLRFRNTNLRLTASVGVAIYPDHGDNTEDLVAHADTAMYQAKKQGKNTWSLYNPERDDSELMVERMSWSRRIALALEQDLLILHFQGIYSTENNALSHLEALVRMHDPADPNRLIMPGAFVPYAEKTGQIVEIDRTVLSKSIAVLAQYPELPALAINLSGRSFDEPCMPAYIKQLLDEHAINPQRLIIELTETETVADIQEAQCFIEAINKTGCRVCLDDFGSGFSTFVYLKYLNVQILKIDGIFISDLINNHENQVFVKAMVSIAQGLGKSVVAEFVENADTMEILKNFGVQFVQGYFLDKPKQQHTALC